MATRIMSFSCRNNCEKHLIAAICGLIEEEAVDPILPLAGVSIALQLLSCEVKEDPAALEACLGLMLQVIERFDGEFQQLYRIKTYLQQISFYLMEHLFPKVLVSSFRSWNEAERVSSGVLSSFSSLMEDQETQLGTSSGLMKLLDAFLPSKTASYGWDAPLIACLADALSLTAQLGPIIYSLVKQAVMFEKYPTSSGQARRMLEDALGHVLHTLRFVGSTASQFFVALVLARELVVQSVTLIERATGDERAGERLQVILGQTVDLLQFQLVELNNASAEPIQVCRFEGRSLHVEQFPTAFASLFMVAATRHCNLPSNIAVAQLFAAVAMKAPGSDLHHLLQQCKAEAVAFSNVLGLSMLLPDQNVPEILELVNCLHDIGSEDEAVAARAKDNFAGMCHAKRDNYQALLQCLRSVGEIACMQGSAQDENTVDRAFQIAGGLPDSLGPAARLLTLAVDDGVDWNIEGFLSMDREKAWSTSIMAHLLGFLGAAHKDINKVDIPPAVQPFTAFTDLNQSVLNTTFWPGLPDDWWQALRYSGLHKHLHPINGNIVWAQCQCGYRYCYAQCGAPVSSQPCASPEGEGRCTLRNGGQDHEFAPNQRLIAVVVTEDPHGDGWPPVFPTMKQNFPEAFQPPAPSPGLFALTEADLHTSVTSEHCAAVSNSLMSETVRQNWNEPLGKPPSPSSGLHPVSFRVLHLLVHASALLSIEMEWVQERENIVHLLQVHLRHVARMNCVRNANDTVWYFMANVEADLAALAKLLNGTVEVATLFIHAVLHRLGSLKPGEQPRDYSLTSHAGRVAYENWFHQKIIQPVLGEKNAAGDFALPGVHDLRRKAGQATDPDVVLTTDFLARRGLPTDAWWSMSESARSALLPHILRPLVSATVQDTFEELVVASNGGDRFVILRLLMTGLDEDGRWQIQHDLLRAACLAWILPCMRLVRQKEGGQLTMRDARRITIRQWLQNLASHEQTEAWSLFRNCEAAWNAALASDNVRVACHFLPLPALSAESPLALLCPIVEPEKLRHGDLAIGDHADPPEHVAAVALHTLAVSHNKLIAQVHAYLNSNAAVHVNARLHPSPSLCERAGKCFHREDECNEHKLRLIQHASTTDLLVFPSQVESIGPPEDDMLGPRTFTLNYEIERRLETFFQIPWGADLPTRGTHDFAAMENDLAWRLVAARRPLQVCSED